MQSISGTGNVASTPIKTVATTGLYLVNTPNLALPSGQLHITCNGVSLSGVSGSPKPVPARLAAGDVLEYNVTNSTGPWSFDFELYDLSATPEIA